MALDVAGIKEGHKHMWSVGDYPTIAERIQGGSDIALREVGASAGDSLLDIATGTGNVAIPAARLGAKVTGLDLTPELLVVARQRAGDAGVEVEFVEGDAEELPFENGSFDRATSVFGLMFAPRQQRAAAEITRVVAPGGTFAIAAWTPDGMNGQMFATVNKYMPPPDPEFTPPVKWGVEDHVRGLFADQPVELEFQTHAVTFEQPSADTQVTELENKLGPVMLAKQALEPQGKWEDLRADLLALESSHNTATDGSFRAEAEYLLTIGRVAV